FRRTAGPTPGGLGRAHGGCLLRSRFLGRRLFGSRFLCGGFLGSSLLRGRFGGAACRINVFPHLHRERISIVGRCPGLGFLVGLIGHFGGNTVNFCHSRFP